MKNGGILKVGEMSNGQIIKLRTLSKSGQPTLDVIRAGGSRAQFKIRYIP